MSIVPAPCWAIFAFKCMGCLVLRWCSIKDGKWQAPCFEHRCNMQPLDIWCMMMYVHMICLLVRLCHTQRIRAWSQGLFESREPWRSVTKPIATWQKLQELSSNSQGKSGWLWFQTFTRGWLPRKGPWKRSKGFPRILNITVYLRNALDSFKDMFHYSCVIAFHQFVHRFFWGTAGYTIDGRRGR